MTPDWRVWEESMWQYLKLIAALAAVFGVGFSAPALAAFIAIDDSDPANITISAGDFEGGFSVNGSLLTIGLGSSASLTLPDGGNSISGTWIDLGEANNTRVDLLFALPGNPTFTTSGIEFGVTSDGTNATLSGSFGGFIDPSFYFFTTLPTLPQDGGTGIGGVAFLSVSFISEGVGAVPEPGTLALLGLAAAVLLGLRRRETR